MKIEMIVHIKNDDGTLRTESTVREVDIPNDEAFTGPETFGEVFDQYERKMLEARNEVAKGVTEKYLSTIAKKNAVRGRDTRRKNTRKAKALYY
jgi:hypothetical protein